MNHIAVTPRNVVLTERAAKRIGKILGKEAAGHGAAHRGGGRRLLGLPVRVQGRPGDSRLPTTSCSSGNGATVLIDSLSLEFMGGAEIDYRRRPDRPVVPDQEPERGGKLRLRHEFRGRLTLSTETSEGVAPCPRVRAQCALRRTSMLDKLDNKAMTARLDAAMDKADR